MTQKAKQWLAKKDDIFSINPQDGGLAGSLVGLGHIKRETAITGGVVGLITASTYSITRKGKEWIKHQRRQKEN